MIKVLFVASFPPPVHGSAMVSQYVANLIEPDYDVHRVNIGSNDVLASYGSNTLKKSILGLFKLLRLIKEISGGFNKVYFTPAINGPAFWRDIIIVLLIKLKNPRASLILHMHNKGLEKSYIRRAFFNLITKSHSVIALSKKLALPYRNRVVVVKNFPIGIPENSIKPRKKIERIGYLSNYIIAKGILTFVDIAMEFRNKDLEFMCAGKDADCTKEELLSLIDFHGLSNLVVSGPKYNDDKWTFLDSLDVLLFPTTYSNECSPLVLLEAMSRGVLVISFNEGGIEDMLPKDTSCLVSGKNMMIATLNKLINDPSMFVEERVKQDLFFRSNFTEENFIKDILELFNDQSTY